MIENLNLASRPFRNRALPWAIVSVVSFASLVALVFTFGAYQQTRTQADAVERDVAELRRDEAAQRARAAQVAEALTPEQRRVLDAAHLIAERKNFSWSRLFADLEASLPIGVRGARINVRDLTQTGERLRADLDMTVIGRTPDDITLMIAQMARTGIFDADLLTENTRPAKGESGIESNLRVRYTARAAAPINNAASRLSGSDDATTAVRAATIDRVAINASPAGSVMEGTR